MIRRHPHVFSDADMHDTESISAAWEQIKESETGHHTLSQNLDDISVSLPALKYTAKIFKKACRNSAASGSSSEIIAEIREVLDIFSSDSVPEDLSGLCGYLLILCSFLCFHSGTDGEVILHQAADRLKQYLHNAEALMIKDGKSFECLTFSELCVYLKHVEGEIE